MKASELQKAFFSNNDAVGFVETWVGGERVLASMTAESLESLILDSKPNAHIPARVEQRGGRTHFFVTP